MTKNPVFKVGDLVVYINNDYDLKMSPRYWNDARGIPLGAPCRVTHARPGDAYYEVMRLKRDLKTELPRSGSRKVWAAYARDIHPLYDEP